MLRPRFQSVVERRSPADWLVSMRITRCEPDHQQPSRTCFPTALLVNSGIQLRDGRQASTLIIHGGVDFRDHLV
jgi:hypothetical protein